MISLKQFICGRKRSTKKSHRSAYKKSIDTLDPIKLNRKHFEFNENRTHNFNSVIGTNYKDRSQSHHHTIGDTKNPQK